MNVPKRQRCPQLGMGSLLEPPPRRSGRRQRTGSPSRLLSSSAQMQSANVAFLDECRSFLNLSISIN
eukprot:scaffold54724_cov17-Tisochrysis_lutea.AAC.1